MESFDRFGIYIENHHALLITILFGVCGLGLVIWFITSLAAEEVKVVPNKKKMQDQGPSIQQPKLNELPTMSYEELSQHCDGEKVYLGLKGVVFDVSSNEVYREGGGYHVFAGKDASVALAKMNFADELMDPTKTHWTKEGELDEKQWKVLDEWVVFYEKRYKIIAKLEDPPKNVGDKRTNAKNKKND